jgi:hypothetical protein
MMLYAHGKEGKKRNGHDDHHKLKNSDRREDVAYGAFRHRAHSHHIRIVDDIHQLILAALVLELDLSGKA